MALPVNIETLLNKENIESNRIEFKKDWNPKKIYQTICAFANDFDNIGGGYILVGVEEKNGIAIRPVTGISENQIDRIQQSMIGFDNKINPYYYARRSVEKVDGRYVLAIWVPAGTDRPYDVMDDVTSRTARPKWYIRSLGSTIEAKGATLVELRDMANRIPFDDRGNPDITLDSLSPLLMQDYLKKIGSKLASSFAQTPFDVVLNQLDMYTGSTERRLLKNISAMMFCETPEVYFPYTQVDIVIFPEGVEANPNNMIEVPKITGSVPNIIKSTLEYLRINVIKELIIKQERTAESISIFNYPYQALEEAVVNALYHRDYQQREPVEIRIEPHAISILSYSGPDRSISDKALKEAR